MIRLFQIAVFSCLGLLLIGCNGPEQSEPIWQHVKIGDLAPSHSGKRPGDQLLKSINFSIYIFEVPAENISVLDDVWQMLHKKPLRFNNQDAFRANSFSAGFGQVQMWDEIGELLRAAGGKAIDRISLLLFDGQADDLFIAGLESKQDIFYISANGSMEGATLGPGILTLRIKAEKIPGARGVCRIAVLPVFSPPVISSVPRLAARAKAGEFLFSPIGFELKMSPGDFFFLGPQKQIDRQITLAGLFFSRPPLVAGGGRPAVPDGTGAFRAFLFICTGIND